MEIVPDELNDPPRWKTSRKISADSQQSASTQESVSSKRLLKDPAKYEKPLKQLPITKMDSGEIIRNFQLLSK